MNVVPYRKQHEYRPMSNMLSLFDDFFNRVNEDDATEDTHRAMAMNIVELEKEFELTANLPGFKKEDIKISVLENQLLIEANSNSKTEEQKGTVYRCERYSGSYRRSLLLPENADIAKIIAKMNDGVLKLEIPKKEPSPKQEIKIN